MKDCTTPHPRLHLVTAADIPPMPATAEEIARAAFRTALDELIHTAVEWRSTLTTMWQVTS